MLAGVLAKQKVSLSSHCDLMCMALWLFWAQPCLPDLQTQVLMLGLLQVRQQTGQQTSAQSQQRRSSTPRTPRSWVSAQPWELPTGELQTI